MKGFPAHCPLLCRKYLSQKRRTCSAERGWGRQPSSKAFSSASDRTHSSHDQSCVRESTLICASRSGTVRSQEFLELVDLVSLLDFSTEELGAILKLAAEVKANPDHYGKTLRGATLFMYFEKPSLRTRITFEAGMTQLGGHAIYYTAGDGKIGVRESIRDVARNLDRWVDGAMLRTFHHALVADLAASAERNRSPPSSQPPYDVAIGRRTRRRVN